MMNILRQKRNKRTRRKHKKPSRNNSSVRHNKTQNKTKNLKQLKKVNCSPKEKNEINEFTCYTDKSLYKLRDLWNARHPDVKINTTDTKEIHKLLTIYLRNVCNKESCWLKQTKDFWSVF